MIKWSIIPSHARQSQIGFFEPVAVFSLTFICWLLGGAASSASIQQSEEARELVPNISISREIFAGEKQSYRVNLDAGTYLRVAIKPKSTNLETKLLGPDGSEDRHVAYLPGEHGSSTVSLAAEVSGSYRLEVDLAEGAKSGSYEVRIEELRPATEQDRTRVAAERAEGEGRVLMDHAHTVERRRQGIARYEEALALWRKLGDTRGALRTLVYLGSQHDYIGEPQSALEYRKQAIEIARSVGDRYQEANLLLAFGLLNLNSGGIQEALDSFNQARELFKSESKRYGEALAIQNIAMALLRLGEWQNALPYLEEALPTLSSVGDRFSECNALNIMGKIHRFLGDKQKAVDFHTRALASARASNSTQGKALSLGHLGDAYLELGDKQKALDCYEQSLKLSRTAGQRLYQADALKRIGDVSCLSKDYQKALDSLNESLGLYRSTLDRAGEARALHGLAEVNYSLGNFDEARRQIEQALDIQESLRSNVISQQLREAILTSAQDSFALYIDLLMQLHKKDLKAGYETAALQVSERARARSLLELLSESQADIREGVAKNLLELERSLRQKINAKAEARTRLLSDTQTQAQTLSFDKEIAELTERLREVKVEIRRSSPHYAALTQPQPLTAIQIQQLLDDDTVLLEFAIGEKHSWLWTIARSSMDVYQLPPGSEIESSARKVYELLAARQPRVGETEAQYQSRFNEAEQSFHAKSATLSQMLLGQIAAKLEQVWKGKRLAIVAPGALEYIPFAALPIPQRSDPDKQNGQLEIGSRQSAEALITQHEILNLPSASALAAIRSETAGRKRAEKTLAILADPVFDLSDPRLPERVKKALRNNAAAGIRAAGEAHASSGTESSSTPNSALLRSLRTFAMTNQRGGFSRLPFSREEAEEISLLAPKASLMKATDFKANRSTAVSGELSNYRIIHFATHGLLNSEQPDLSGLVLSLVDQDGKLQDGFLRMNEIYNLNLAADLVVLSACQTALGKQIQGEGLVGLTRGFMYAGAQRIVASLWQVDDLATAHLMKSFYRGMLVDGLRPAAALRAAQMQTRKQKRWSSPFFWAAFTIQGEWK